MSITTYEELKSAITDWLDDSELSGHVDSFIDLAEARHKREIRIREMQVRESLTLSEGSDADTDRYLALSGLSATFLDLKSLRLKIPTTASGRAYYPPLEELADNEMMDVSVKDGRRPGAFKVWAEEIEFDSMADQAYTVELFFYKEMEALSDATASNALLARAPDAYLYAALSATAPFLVDDPRLQTWEALYAAVRDSLNQTERESRRGGPLVSRVRGLPPRRY